MKYIKFHSVLQNLQREDICNFVGFSPFYHLTIYKNFPLSALPKALVEFWNEINARLGFNDF